MNYNREGSCNNWAVRFGGLYLGEEYVIPNSGGHLMEDLRAVSDIIQKLSSLLLV